MSYDYESFATGGCFGPGGVILPASKCGSRAGTTKPAPSSSPPPKHTGSGSPKHSSSGGCFAAGGEILPASQCKKLGIKPGTQSHTIGAQGQKVAAGQKSPSKTSGVTGGVIGPGGQIYASPAYAAAYMKQYGMPYNGTVGYYDNMGNFQVRQPDGSTGYYDKNNVWHDNKKPTILPGVAPTGSGAVINPIRDYLGSKGADNPTGLNHFANYARVNAGAGVLQQLTSGHAKLSDVPNIIKQGLCSLGAPLCGSAPGYNAPASVIREAGAVGKRAAVVGKATEGLVGMAPDIMMNILRPLWEQQGLLPKKPVTA